MFDPELVAWLGNPASYPHACGDMEFVETHISLVALAGEHVYKLKRPVRYSYLDFSTLALRHEACRKEVELNQRLAPGVHLGVLAITREAGGFAWNGPGDVVEYAVHMRRLPAERCLATLLDRAAVKDDEFERLGDVLAQFYRAAATSDDIAAAATPQALERLVAENMVDARELPTELVSPQAAEEIGAALRQYLHDHQGVFAERARRGRVRDGHGDLRAEQVYLLDPPVVIDCIEFNDALRYVDIASDAAFLANDLEAAGRYDLSAALIERLAAVDAPAGFAAALAFYQALRAWVRAKVAATAVQRPDIRESERARWRRRTAHDLERTLVYARRIAAPKIVLLCGLPGSGKSTVARIVHERLGMIWLRSDVIRKELAAGAETAESELYGERMTQRTYAELLRRAETAVRCGRSVVLDATFGRRFRRQSVVELARHLDVRVVVMECVCPEPVLRARRARRVTTPDSASDATIAQLETLRAEFEPVNELPPTLLVRIDTSGADERVARAVLDSVWPDSRVTDGRSES